MAAVANDFSTFLELVRYRGDGPISIPLTNPDDGTDFTPTGCALIFTLKAAETDADLDALIQKVSTVGGITVANPSIVTLVPADFAALTAGVTYEFDIQAQLSASPNTIRTVARGTIKFAYDITEETTISIATTTTNPAAGYSWANIPDKPNVVETPVAIVGLTGGGATKLDGITVLATLEAGAMRLVYLTSGDVLLYRLFSSSAAEASPWIIAPDDGAALRWRLQTAWRDGVPLIWNPTQSKFHQLSALGAAGAETLLLGTPITLGV
ncbi:MAG TPA: hypothetical protein VLH79_06815 [Chthonomonadales bacterium]|nr:hypothetical protein [Chthonomonadales bacterium]